ncbi:hypothetical protein EZJ43_06330 [Pedobacter changchengzhani]|uniref:Long-subunit fatty acid transport protein n=1 Tax=Pedobacter changchengzhani TaxID=2529274 RepID=A0A4R5MMJ1_9SPHI|nr:hypothetical protein [Pedobacter changchengzhani]TDG36892.1 hypothetical protein EZJ43_06330 [Pedobacter changchengzhani]
MKKIYLALLVATVATTGTTYAQSYAPDAYRFSQMNYGSTSRFKAMGNAQIGVGGDIGSLGANPAGLGLFTKSEFSLTPEFNNVQNTSDFLNQNTNGTKGQLNLNNIGAVFYSPNYKTKGTDVNTGLVSAVFGLGYNRNNDFLNNIDYQGTNNLNSIRDAFVDQANDNGTSNSVAGDAFNSHLINNNTTQYPNQYSAEPYTGVNPFNQNYTESRLGSTSEFNVAGALNFGNKLYVGATVSFVNVRYVSEASFQESGKLQDLQPGEDGTATTLPGGSILVHPIENYSLNYTRNQDTKGSGVNIKLGMIYRPVSEFRVGVTFQSPTWMTVQDNVDEGVNSIITNDKSNNNLQNYYFSYRLRTPLKASAGASYVIGGRALISADIDYVDYASMRFSQDNGSDISTINSSNRDVKDFYKETINYRFGAEVKVSNEVSLRAGYGINGSGVKNGKDKFFQTQAISGGLGYRIDNYYFDLTYQNLTSNFYSSAYELNDGSETLASVKNQRNNVFLTFGVRF